jgi:hypothetical protein
MLYGYFTLINKNINSVKSGTEVKNGDIQMKEKKKTDYSAYDNPSVLAFLFYPQQDYSATSDSGAEILIPVEDGVAIGAKMFIADKSAPTILFFHGNGEIVPDYDDLGQIYNQLGINFIPVDYRGYGKSTGSPTVTTMMKDCHNIFRYIGNWRKDNNITGPFIVMGRSLGSASALELASNYPDSIDGLIIESGFAHALPLLRLLGINTDRLGLKEDGFSNNEKIKNFKRPTLIIHAEFDQIIPFSDGKALYESSPAADKTFVKIPDADHNTIFAYGIKEYMAAVKTLADKAGK